MVDKGIKTLVCASAFVVIEGVRRPLAMDWILDLSELLRRVADSAMLDCGAQFWGDHCKHAYPSRAERFRSVKVARALLLAQRLDLSQLGCKGDKKDLTIHGNGVLLTCSNPGCARSTLVLLQTCE